MDIENVKKLADGRVYSAEQAFANGLVDRVEGWEDALHTMEEKTGVEGYEKHFTSSASWLDQLLYKVSDIMPKSDMDNINQLVSSDMSCVPLYMMAN